MTNGTTSVGMKEKVMTIMSEKLEELKADWKEAKDIFADVMLDDNSDYRCKDARRLRCNNLKAQVELLQYLMEKVSAVTCEIILHPIDSKV